MLATLYTEFLVAILAIVFAVFVFRPRRPKKFPPGPLAIPVLGNLHQLGTEPYKTFMSMGEKYGGIFAIDFASFRGVVLNDYKLIRQCFNDPVFSGRPKLRPFAERSGGKPRGIIFTEGDTWTEQRRFVLRNLRDFGFGKKSIEGVIHDEIHEVAESFRKELGKPVSTQLRFNAAVLNSLWKMCAGERYEHDDPKFLEVIAIVASSIANSGAAGAFFFFPTISKLAPEMTGYNRFLNMHQPIIDLIKDKVEEHKLTYEEGHNRDLIDVYWQQILSTSDRHSSFFETEGEHNLLIGLVDLFMAGAETTSTTLSWTFLLLALNPEVQEKVYEEIVEKIGTSRLPSLADKFDLPYTECVILEVLRFSSLVPLGVFHNTTEDVMVDGYLIPKDTLVMPNLYAALRDPAVWGDPEVFRPERFLLPDGSVNRHHEAHIVFSVGKRVCLGETLARDELFLFTTSLFQQFKVSTDPNQPKPTVDYHHAPILVPKYHELIVSERH